MTRAPSMWYPSDPVPPSTGSGSYDSDDSTATSVAGAAGQALPASLASHPDSDAEDWGQDGG